MHHHIFFYIKRYFSDLLLVAVKFARFVKNALFSKLFAVAFCSLVSNNPFFTLIFSENMMFF
ncbi:hypothetical protein COT72_03165 [archaeon CG10_big_fil_rev_8_21_14_0_10_43_11]|nr:MAG: hypothetical protein COT72_03165 [archaeon CG10_big_fil_rev_8_21_14_0_10_43_11]